MALGVKLLLLTLFVAVAAVVFIWFFAEEPKVPQHYFSDKYYGNKVLKANEAIPKDSTQIRKFVIKIDDSVIDDLKQRLNATRFVEPLVGVNFEYGFNGNQLKQVVDYWINKYDWRKHESELNKYEHFKTQIEGIDVHFIHIKPIAKSAKRVVPLLIVHGWPGSVYEYYKTIPLLQAADKGVAFELIIPSIPGYGFSEAPHQPGFSPPDAARVFSKLMERLGHKQYYFHGGDWGAIIGRFMALMYPEKILGFHTSFISSLSDTCSFIKLALGYLFPSFVYENPEIELKKFTPIQKTLSYLIRETGYMYIQATKPDTISVGLLNSPAGLAAYILEKFSTWVNKDYIHLADGGLKEKFTYDELLTNVMIYWITNTIPSSVRFYKEYFSNVLPVHPELERVPISKQVPIGLSVFPEELINLPKFTFQHLFPNIIHYKHLPKGGHFAAFEEPEITANEIREFVVKCIELKEAQQRKAEKEANSKKK